MSNPAVYLMGTHRYAFRPYEIAVVHGLVMFPGPLAAPPRVCFHAIYPDGMEDFIVFSDVPSNYQIGSYKVLAALAEMSGHK